MISQRVSKRKLFHLLEKWQLSRKSINTDIFGLDLAHVPMQPTQLITAGIRLQYHWNLLKSQINKIPNGS